MDKSRETWSRVPEAAVAETWRQAGASFERFCLTAGVSALSRMMEQDAIELCGPRYGHKDGKAGLSVPLGNRGDKDFPVPSLALVGPPLYRLYHATRQESEAAIGLSP